MGLNGGLPTRAKYCHNGGLGGRNLTVLSVPHPVPCPHEQGDADLFTTGLGRWRSVGTGRESVNQPAHREDPGSGVYARPRASRRSKLGRVIVTIAPSIYLVTRILIRTGDVEVAIGAGLICPLVVWYIAETWVQDGSRLMRRSWNQWCADRTNEWPLLAAAAGALIVIGFLTVMWFGVSFVSRY